MERKVQIETRYFSCKKLTACIKMWYNISFVREQNIYIKYYIIRNN